MNGCDFSPSFRVGAGRWRLPQLPSVLLSNGPLLNHLPTDGSCLANVYSERWHHMASAKRILSMLGFDKLDFLVSILYVYDMNKCKIYMGTPRKWTNVPKKEPFQKERNYISGFIWTNHLISDDILVLRGVPGPLLSPPKNGIIGKGGGLRIWNLDFPPMRPGTGMGRAQANMLNYTRDPKGLYS